MRKKSLETHALKSRINDFHFLRGCFDGLFDNAFSSNWGFAAESTFNNEKKINNYQSE